MNINKQYSYDIHFLHDSLALECPGETTELVVRITGRAEDWITLRAELLAGALTALRRSWWTVILTEALIPRLVIPLAEICREIPVGARELTQHRRDQIRFFEFVVRRPTPHFILITIFFLFW